ncbi:MAG: calcium load-activated calcium channel-like [Streblomastix strix]|uniref:Calcium load-activated calcium channel-like n=1 Tax=Streblomastix strix TaxID=222440 RepID=A0A5J4WPI4_9EUKA|nr:MAG: calcium load-activated calcium channel-like [Streblomastix strix]KAA6396907.1 MAG: calcium load-activated calcium channel-like [Streblomastix strix]
MIKWIFVVIYSAVTAILSEFLSYILVYRRTAFKDKLEAHEKSKMKIERIKQGTTKPGLREKKLASENAILEETQQALQMEKMKGTVVVSVLMFVLGGIFNQFFDGVVLARLPFQPISIVKNFSHRHILGDDYQEVGNSFLFMLCSLSIKPTISRILKLNPEIPSAMPTMFQNK